jgi:hypothetical protein
MDSELIKQFEEEEKYSYRSYVVAPHAGAWIEIITVN